MSVVTTFVATIYCGSRVGYSDELVPLDVGEKVVQEYVNEIGKCFSVTRTLFIYRNGQEPGLAVGAINYPRFPKATSELEKETTDLAERLRRAMRQQRVSVVLPDRTVMLGGE